MSRLGNQGGAQAERTGLLARIHHRKRQIIWISCDLPGAGGSIHSFDPDCENTIHAEAIDIIAASDQGRC